MTEPVVVILGLVGTAVVGSVVTAVAKIFSVYTIQGRIEQKLDDHISDEQGKFKRIDERFDDVDRRLPNGEIKRILTTLVEIQRRQSVNSLRRRRTHLRAAAAARGKR